MSAGNGAGVARTTNAYMFDICFDPERDEGNRIPFADYSQLGAFGFETERGERFRPSKQSLKAGFDLAAFCRCCQQHREGFQALRTADRRVLTSNYATTLRASLPQGFDVLDAMLAERLDPPADGTDSAAED